VAGADLAAGLRAGLLGTALGEALGLPWTGVGPRAIRRDRILEGVGPTGAVTAAVLAAATTGDVPAAHGGGAAALPVALAVGWRRPDRRARRAEALALGLGAVVVADLAAAMLEGRAVHHLIADHADDWPPPFRGVAYEERAIVDALLAVLQRHDDPSEAMRAAVRLGRGRRCPASRRSPPPSKRWAGCGGRPLPSVRSCWGLTTRRRTNA
jgi:hypothetical protein